MAVQNYVMLNGQIIEILANFDKDRIPTSLLIIIKVIRRKGSLHSLVGSNIKVEFPMVVVREREQIEKLMKMEKGDMIEVVGVLCTVPARKNYKCTSCGAQNSYIGTKTYVSPTYVCLKETGRLLGSPISMESGWPMIKERGEVSNYVNIIGTLCRDVQFYNENHMRVCTYQVAVNRKLHIEQDPPEIRTDYIWVKSLGEQAEKDAQALHMGSRIVVIGSLQSRNRVQGDYSVSHTCIHCGAENKLLGDTMEVVPYSVEYLENYNLLDSKRYADEDESESFLADDEDGGWEDDNDEFDDEEDWENENSEDAFFGTGSQEVDN